MSTRAGRPGARRSCGGQGDAALSWEGLRAQWKGQGLDFDYLLGRNFSKLPANSFVIRKADFEDTAEEAGLYTAICRAGPPGWSSGSQNPRAATQIVMEQFPGLSSQMTPDGRDRIADAAANCLQRPLGRAEEVGLPHHADSWKLFFDVGREIGQITGDFKVEDVVKNDLIDEANAFDAAKVKADADGFALSGDYEAVDVDAIQKAL